MGRNDLIVDDVLGTIRPVGNHAVGARPLAPGESADAQAKPRPGQDGWSEPVYFSDDRIDLAKFYEGFKEGRVSGFAEFRLPQAVQA